MKKVLIADTCDIDRKLLSSNLTSIGFQIFQTCNGQKAYQIFLAENPSIIITNIIMPEMDGIELMSCVHKKSKNTIVIGMSNGGTYNFDYEKTWLKLGANKFSNKPLNITEILSYIKHYV